MRPAIFAAALSAICVFSYLSPVVAGDWSIDASAMSGIEVPEVPTPDNASTTKPTGTPKVKSNPGALAGWVDPAAVAGCVIQKYPGGDWCGKVRFGGSFIDGNGNNPISRRFDAFAKGFMAWDQSTVWIDRNNRMQSPKAKRGYYCANQALKTVKNDRSLDDAGKNERLRELLRKCRNEIGGYDPQITLMIWLTRQGPGVSPAEFFLEAMGYTGSTRAGYYVAHNVAKEIGRNLYLGDPGVNDTFLMKKLTRICSSNAGCWYHFFGTAAASEYMGASLSYISGYIDEVYFKTAHTGKLDPSYEKIHHNNSGVYLFYLLESYYCAGDPFKLRTKLSEYCGGDCCGKQYHR